MNKQSKRDLFDCPEKNFLDCTKRELKDLFIQYDKGLIVSGAAAMLELGSWARLVQDAVITSCLALVSLQLYLGVTSTEKY